eukprot:560266-Prymnesium_polylepis.1
MHFLGAAGADCDAVLAPLARRPLLACDKGASANCHTQEGDLPFPPQPLRVHLDFAWVSRCAQVTVALHCWRKRTLAPVRAKQYATAAARWPLTIAIDHRLATTVAVSHSLHPMMSPCETATENPF